MPRNRVYFTILLTTFVVIFMALSRAAAQVVLKPNGQEATPLRLKAMTAKVRLQAAQFATTDLDLIFQNELDYRIEADFLYTVPDGAVVIDFAYFYGTERVPARIAEKERAAAIYRHITTRMRDPALVEMVGKNTFRARIFPVMPNADLRVQIRYVQTLPVQAGNTVTYSLPLKSSKEARLDAVSIDIESSPLEPGMRLVNNFGLPLNLTTGAPHILFSGTQYRTDQDLRVTLYLPASHLQAHSIAARSGGPDGFFALAVTGAARLKTNSVRLTGVATYDVESALCGSGLIVTGRYKGSGRARVTVSDVSGNRLSSPPLDFGDTMVENNAASKLWAASRIAHLSASSKNRAAVVALSSRYTLPSKWTSWIAIPEAERKRYAREKAEADLEPIVERLARLIEQGQGKSTSAQSLRAQFGRVYRLAYNDHPNANLDIDESLKEYLQGHFYRSIGQAAEDVAHAIATGTDGSAASRRARARLNYLCQSIHENPDEALSNALYNERSQRLERFLDMVEQGRNKTPEGRLVWNRLRIVTRAIHEDTDRAVREAAGQRLSEAADQWVQNEHGEFLRWGWYWEEEAAARYPVSRLNAAQRDALKTRLDRLTHAAHKDIYDVIEQAETPWRQQEMVMLRKQIIEERRRNPMDSSRVSELENQFLAEVHNKRQKQAAEYRHFYYKSNTPENREAYAQDRLARIAARIEGEQLDALLKMPPSGTDVAELRTRRAAAKQREEELRARMGDPLISVEAPAEAQAVVARMPDGTTLPLVWNAAAERWQARFDIPTTAAEGAYDVNVIILLRDGTRRTTTFRYNVDVTAPQGTAKITRAENGILRLEVDASPDTARVAALLPDDTTLPLHAEASRPGHFFALAPAPASSVSGTITLLLTDRAHNRTVLIATLPEVRP